MKKEAITWRTNINNHNQNDGDEREKFASKYSQNYAECDAMVSHEENWQNRVLSFACEFVWMVRLFEIGAIHIPTKVIIEMKQSAAKR